MLQHPSLFLLFFWDMLQLKKGISMKPHLLILCILNTIIISPRLHAMDDDKAISLKKISHNPLKQQFINFEQKLSAELNQDNWLMKKEIHPAAYIKRLHTELPKIFESERTIEKFYRIQNSYLAKAINKLITDYGYNHYKKVTGDTLTSIRNSEKHQSCQILNELPLRLKQYVMQKTYNDIKQEFVCTTLSKKSEIFDIHASIDSAAVIDRDSKTFQIWNLKTGELTHEIPNASDNSLIRFSADGSIIITTSLFSKDSAKVYIMLWNRETKKCLMEFLYSNQIKNIFFKDNTLSIFNKTGEIYLTMIDVQNKKRHGTLEINAGIETMNPPFTFQWKYHLNNNAILKKSFSYFICAQAIRNTSSIISLKKIYDTPFYNSPSLTFDQRKMLHQKIEAKIKKLGEENAKPSNLMGWFG